MRKNFLCPVLLMCFLAPCPAEEQPSLETLMHLRVDFYDLPASVALGIQQGVSLSPDQSKVVEEINAMVETGQAEFVASALLTGPMGSRAKFEDTETVLVIESFEWNEEAKELVPKFTEGMAGTVFEVDPTIAKDGETILLNFALEHHTAPPVTEEIMIPLGKTDSSREVSVTRFFRKKVTSKIQLKSGTAALIAAFEITGSQETGDSESEPDFKRLVFLSAELLGPAVEKSDESPKKPNP